MNQSEKALIKRITEKTKLGEIKWTNKGENEFTAEIDGLVLTLRWYYKTGYYNSAVDDYYLDIQNGKNITSFVEQNPWFHFPIAELYQLVCGEYEKKQKADKDSERSRIASELTALLQ